MMVEMLVQFVDYKLVCHVQSNNYNVSRQIINDICDGRNVGTIRRLHAVSRQMINDNCDGRNVGSIRSLQAGMPGSINSEPSREYTYYDVMYTQSITD